MAVAALMGVGTAVKGEEVPSLDLNFDGQLSSFRRTSTSPTAPKANGDQLATEIVTQNKTGSVQSKYMGPNGKLINGYVDNLVPHSTDFSTSAGWTHGSSLSLTTGQADPFGGTNATTISDNDSAGFAFIDYSVAPGSDLVFTASLFIKKQSNTTADQVCLFRLRTGTTLGLFDLQIKPQDGSYNLIDRQVVQPAILEAIREDFGDWWRFSVTAGHPNYTTTDYKYQFFPTVGTSFVAPAGSYDNTATGAVTIFGAQFEVAGSPSQYVSSTASPAQVPRVEYDASGNALGLLVEEARTNLVPFSDLTNAAWTAGTAYTVDSASDSPSGGGDAAEITVAATGNAWLYDDVSATGLVGQTVTYSLFAKSTNSTLTLKLQMIGATNTPAAQLQVNPSTGGSATDTSTNITLSDYGSADVGNGWHRYWMSFVVPSNTTTLRPNIVAAQGTTYVYGTQVEQGEGATSYIPTSGASATRTADNISVATSAFGYTDVEGTVVSNFTLASVSAGAPHVWSVQNSAGLSKVAAFVDLSATPDNLDLMYRSYAGGANPTTYRFRGTVTTATYGSTTALAMRYAEGNFGSALNGTLSTSPVENSSGETYTGLSRTDVYLGSSNTFSIMNGHIRRFMYFPRAINDAQLSKFTNQ